MSVMQEDEVVVPADVQERINQFTMPRPRPGMSVLWYRHGVRMGGPHGEPEMAFVLKVSNRNIKVQTADGMVYTPVPHIEDPKLQVNDYQRMNGAWEFTEEHRFFVDTATTLLGRIEALDKKIADLRKEVECLQPKKSKSNANEIL